MFFAILMSDGPISALPSRKIPGQSGNDEGSQALGSNFEQPHFLPYQPISDITLPSSCHFSTDLSFRPNGVNGEIPLPTIQRCSSDLLHYPYPTPWTEKARKMWRRCHFLIEIDSGRSLSLKEVDSGVWLSVCPNLVNIWATNFTGNQKIRIGKGFTTGSDEVSADKIHQNRAGMPEDFAGTVVKNTKTGIFMLLKVL